MRLTASKKGVGVSHTVNLGICKLTIGSSGITVSTGIPGLRVSAKTDGTVGVRAGIPGTGLKFEKRKKLLSSKKK